MHAMGERAREGTLTQTAIYPKLLYQDTETLTSNMAKWNNLNK